MKSKIAWLAEKAIKRAVCDKKLNLDDATDLMSLFFSSYITVAVPYCLAFFQEGSIQTGKDFIKSETAYLEKVLREELTRSCKEKGLLNPWATGNEKLTEELMDKMNRGG